MNLAYPKPKHVRLLRAAVHVFRDGREQCDLKIKAGRVEYRRRVELMWKRQRSRCGLQITADCKRRSGSLDLEAATFEHEDGRGHGGGHRDDRIVKDGYPYNLAACFECNREKGSRRLRDLRNSPCRTN